MEQDAIVRIRSLNKTFTGRAGRVTALDGIDLDIRRGEIFGIIGLSGAGKSTLVRCINFLEKPTAGTVTVDGVTHPVPAPFTVIATENPVGAAGTQMLPQSQLDRFTVCVVMGYPDTEAEMQMLAGRGQRTLLEQVHPVANQADLLAMQKEVAGVFIHELMYRYIVDLAQASRKEPRLALGLSPRASLALAGMARAAAYLAGRDFVAPQDVTAVFADVARHRLVLADQAKAGGETVDVVIDDLLRTVPRPRPEKADRHGR